MYRNYEYIKECEEKLKKEFNKIDEISFINSRKVLNAFHNQGITDSHFNSTTGYGYDDYGRDTIEKVYREIFHTEDALVRGQLISGTHALTVTLFGLLRPGDTMLSITGKPYDTLDKVIGITPCDSSLASYNINYMGIDLIDNEFDKEKIKETLENNKIKLITIQRSKGYSTRKSISISKIEEIIKYIREINKDVIIMIDNCYCEFVSDKEPTEVGADIAVGSLIKNLGGGIAKNGGYICGKKELVRLCADRLNVPGQDKEVGPSGENNRLFLQGLYFAPSVVASSLKTAILTSYVMEDLGYQVEPKYNDERVDIVQNIIFNDGDKLCKFCEVIQASSAINSNIKPIPSDMPGYDDKIIMASGSFVNGSSIEISCDGPLRPPFIAYMQGSLTYDYGKIAVMNIINEFKEDRND